MYAHRLEHFTGSQRYRLKKTLRVLSAVGILAAVGGNTLENLATLRVYGAVILRARTTSLAMSDETDRQTNRLLDRRSLLSATATVSVAGLAGCSGGGGGGDGGDDLEQGDGGGDGGDDGQGGDSSGSDGSSGGGGCPSSPSSYDRQPIPLNNDSSEPAVSIEAPASGGSVETAPSLLRVTYGRDMISFSVSVYAGQGVDDVIGEAINEMTDEYDLPSGVRVLGSSSAGLENRRVLLPSDSGAIDVASTLMSDDCLDALRPVRDHMVNSLEVL
jgi:hypothetical protein